MIPKQKLAIARIGAVVCWSIVALSIMLSFLDELRQIGFTIGFIGIWFGITFSIIHHVLAKDIAKQSKEESKK